MFYFCSFLHCAKWVSPRLEGSRIMHIDAPLLLAFAAVITSLSGLIWSIRRRA